KNELERERSLSSSKTDKAPTPSASSDELKKLTEKCEQLQRQIESERERVNIANALSSDAEMRKKIIEEDFFKMLEDKRASELSAEKEREKLSLQIQSLKDSLQAAERAHSDAEKRFENANSKVVALEEKCRRLDVELI